MRSILKNTKDRDTKLRKKPKLSIYLGILSYIHVIFGNMACFKTGFFNDLLGQTTESRQ